MPPDSHTSYTDDQAVSQDPEMVSRAGPGPLRPGGFLQRLQNEDSGRMRTLTLSAHRAKGDRRLTGQKRAFAVSTFCFCFVFFPDSPTKLKVGGSGGAGLSCCLACLRWQCLPFEATLCCYCSTQARVQARARAPGSCWTGPRGALRRWSSSCFHCSFFFPLGPSFPDGVDGPGGGRDLGRGDKKEAGGQPHISWGCCIASWCAEGYHDV